MMAASFSGEIIAVPGNVMLIAELRCWVYSNLISTISGNVPTRIGGPHVPVP
jgi:hypothetical protein